jgi:predicted PurR-regulated permease PerM
METFKRAGAAFVLDFIILFCAFTFLKDALNPFILAAILALLLALPDLMINRMAAMRNGTKVPFKAQSLAFMMIVGFIVSLLLIPGVFGMSSITGSDSWVDASIHALIGASLVATLPILIQMMTPKPKNNNNSGSNA